MGWTRRAPFDFPGEFEVPCGKCAACFMERALMWKTRILHEAKLYRSNYFVTLTYKPEAIPENGNLVYPHFQEFMKGVRHKYAGEVGVKLRRFRRRKIACAFPRSRRGGIYETWPVDREEFPIRFFMCGEYGEENGRPHYHAVLFNLALTDRQLMVNGKFRSPGLDEIWSRGIVEISALNAQRAGYVAGYVNKKAERRSVDAVNRATGELYEREPEFQEMSTTPGIGVPWYLRFQNDFFPQDVAVVDGREVKVPRLYFRRYQQTASEAAVEDVKARRVARAREVPREERTERRRLVKEEVLVRRNRQHRRSL